MLRMNISNDLVRTYFRLIDSSSGSTGFELFCLIDWRLFWIFLQTQNQVSSNAAFFISVITVIITLLDWTYLLVELFPIVANVIRARLIIIFIRVRLWLLVSGRRLVFITAYLLFILLWQNGWHDLNEDQYKQSF